MCKKKTDEKYMQRMTFDFSMNIDIDSSISDRDLPAKILKNVRRIVNNGKCTYVLERITRNAAGVVEYMSGNFSIEDGE